MGLTVVTGPATEPVGLTEAREHLGLPSTETGHDGKLQRMIEMGRRTVEKYTRRSLINQTLKLTMSRFPESNQPIELPRPPLSSVTSVAYIDYAGTSQTLVAGTDYQTVLDSSPGRITPEVNEVWPTVETSREEAVTVTYVAGYGPDRDDVPDDLRGVVLELVAFWFSHRGDFGGNTSFSQQIPLHLRWSMDMNKAGTVSGYYGVTR